MKNSKRPVRPMETNSSAQLKKKTDIEEYDLVVLGSGTGSKIAAWTTAEQGKRVALVERRYIGGSCHNIACMPSKNIIHSAKVASYVRRSREFGIEIDDFRIDMSAVRERKRRMVSHSIDVHLDIFKKRRGDHRRLRPLHRSQDLEVSLKDGTHRQIRGAKVIISTGTHASLEIRPETPISGREKF